MSLNGLVSVVQLILMILGIACCIKYLRSRTVDLVVAGHAHGGQIRLAGRGVFSPGQGLFPRYTYGVVDGRMVMSAGAGNPVHLPRWGNPCEVLRITLD